MINLDLNVFIEKGIIYFYKIEEGSVEYNLMGGIEVGLIINNDLELNVLYILSKNNGELSGGVLVVFEKFFKLLGCWEE